MLNRELSALQITFAGGKMIILISQNVHAAEMCALCL